MRLAAYLGSRWLDGTFGGTKQGGMTMAMMTAQEMFQHEVGDIYDAENRFLKGQQEMLTKASDPQLQGLIRRHIEQTQQHIKNLDQVFGLLGQQPKAVTCDSAQGLVTEAQKAMQEAASDPIRDV